jgi:hypothetical protein
LCGGDFDALFAVTRPHEVVLRADQSAVRVEASSEG